jgi:hypothetical protein
MERSTVCICVSRLLNQAHSKTKKTTMFKTRNIVIALSSLLLICLVLPLVMATEGDKPRHEGGMRQQGGPDGMRQGPMDPQEMQKMILERMKTQLVAIDAEWTKIESPLKKVMTLTNETNPRGAGMRGPRPEQPAEAGEQSAVQKASIAMREVVQKADLTAEEVSARLAAFRAAKEAAKKELAAAQDELKKVVNARQEAKLVLVGMLN